jgi:CheY-like chemotaxis protein
VELRLSLPSRLPPIVADRVLLRQIFLTLLNCALHQRVREPISVGADAQADRVRVWIEYCSIRQSDPAVATQDEIETARYWAQSLDATLERTIDSGGEDSQVRLVLSLAQAAQATVLVVDDQEAALRMFQRYLSMSSVRVVGVREPGQVLPQARSLRPRAIIMDVMMPAMDGWEVLQSLKADPVTTDIPVIICSVWDEPELAFSLGAASFMKKPITRRELLDELARLDKWDGWCAADSAAPDLARGGTAGDAS